MSRFLRAERNKKALVGGFLTVPRVTSPVSFTRHFRIGTTKRCAYGLYSVHHGSGDEGILAGGGGRNNSPGVSNVKSFLIDIPNG